MASGKARTHPGGAPIAATKKKPCAYGPRTEDGKCPKKPRAAKRASKGCSPSQEINPETGRCRAKCKPGYERNAETGRCRKLAAGDDPNASWLDKKIPQGFTPSGNVKTTTARKVGEKIIVQSVESATRSLIDAGYKKYANSKTFKENLSLIATGFLPFAAKVLKGLAWDAATLGAPVALLYIGMAAEAQAEKDRKVQVQIAAYNTVEQIMQKTYLTPEQARALRAQYEAFYLARAKDLAFRNSHGGR